MKLVQCNENFFVYQCCSLLSLVICADSDVSSVYISGSKVLCQCSTGVLAAGVVRIRINNRGATGRPTVNELRRLLHSQIIFTKPWNMKTTCIVSKTSNMEHYYFEVLFSVHIQRTSSIVVPFLECWSQVSKGSLFSNHIVRLSQID